MTSLLMIGCGQMGRALLMPWLAAELFSSVAVIEPYSDAIKILPIDLHADFASYRLAQNAAPDIVVLAVKPQGMKEALASYLSILKSNTLIVTIAAGLRVEFYQTFLNNQINLVRIMPNLPAVVGEGMSVGLATESVTPDQKKLVQKMFATIGKFTWMKSEAQLDAATLISGSGPAYVFLMAEILTATAKAVGFDEEVASLLARQTIVGGGKMLGANPESAAQLRKNVTSPGGVTEAALKILLQDNLLQERFDEAIRNGINRGDELAAQK